MPRISILKQFFHFSTFLTRPDSLCYLFFSMALSLFNSQVVAACGNTLRRRRPIGLRPRRRRLAPKNGSSRPGRHAALPLSHLPLDLRQRRQQPPLHRGQNSPGPTSPSSAAPLEAAVSCSSQEAAPSHHRWGAEVRNSGTTRDAVFASDGAEGGRGGALF